VTEGGAELPVLNIAISTALMIREPDKYSLDRVLGSGYPLGLGPWVLQGSYSPCSTPESGPKSHRKSRRRGPRTRRARS
jgi:hypothetical protein